MADDDAPRPLWRRLLLNRFVLTPAILALTAGAWNLYVVTHNHGVVAGRVVDDAGRPVEGAEVVLWTFNFTTFAEKGHAVTGPDGGFRFADNASHNIQLSAAKPGVGRSERMPIRLYFRAQDVTLAKPLRLQAGA
jgi:hypothetical protein